MPGGVMLTDWRQGLWWQGDDSTLIKSLISLSQLRSPSLKLRSVWMTHLCWSHREDIISHCTTFKVNWNEIQSESYVCYIYATLYMETSTTKWAGIFMVTLRLGHIWRTILIQPCFKRTKTLARCGKLRFSLWKCLEWKEQCCLLLR